MMFILLLTGCSIEQEPIGEFVKVKVKDKRTEEHCGRGCWNDYFITFEKDGTIVELQADEEDVYNLFTKNSIVNVSYYDDYYIAEVEFPALEGDKNETTK